MATPIAETRSTLSGDVSIAYQVFGSGPVDLVVVDVGDPTLEDRMDDLRAVLDAAASARSAVFGFSEGGALAVLYAAAYPARAILAIRYAEPH